MGLAPTYDPSLTAIGPWAQPGALQSSRATPTAFTRHNSLNNHTRSKPQAHDLLSSLYSTEDNSRESLKTR